MPGKPSNTSRDGLWVPCEDGHGEILDFQAGRTTFEGEGRGALVGFDQHEELLRREGYCAFGEDWHFKPCRITSEFHEYPCGTSREDQHIFFLWSRYLGVFQERFDFRECDEEFHRSDDSAGRNVSKEIAFPLRRHYTTLVGRSDDLEITTNLKSLGKTMNQVAEEKESPVAAARARRDDSDSVFLDSGMTATGISILATQPDLVLAGSDWLRLEQELSLRRREGLGHPDGAAIGFVSFDGTYHFAFYDRLHLFSHENRRWINRPHDFDPDASQETGEMSFAPQMSKERFLEMVERAHEYIAAGDIYQVCLSHPFVAEIESPSAWSFFERLRRLSPSPYSAFLNFGDVQIASASPECFIRMSGRNISTRPIKGTRPRKSDQQSDQLSAHDLITSSKEIAELVMITDLERNDLGRVCEYGTVHVPDLLRLEAFEQVFHLVSTVQGKLRNGVSHVQALLECFPGGSIAGAPKKRALEIIRELEPFPRGIYTGAIGYFGYSGESQFSIAIRTAVFEQKLASFHVGAGIVADSIPEKEWQETYDKAAGLLLAARGRPDISCGT